MVVIDIKHIRSFSSEDKKFPAENLLKGDGFKKWRCEKVGEKQASVVLQFDKASTIHSIDIGNEGSAFIEVLVARTSENTEPNFQVLLMASSFMNPQESRNGQNLNRVRMFDRDKLTQSLLTQKWDLAKIVCTQPFNKNLQYGLSFVKFHGPSDTELKDQKPGNLLGMFKMKEKPKEGLKVGSAFQAYKAQVPDVSNATPSASARTVSKFADEVLAREAALVRNAPGKDDGKTVKRKLDDDSEGGVSKRSRDATSPVGAKRNSPSITKRSPSPKPRSKRTPSPKRLKRQSPKLDAKEKLGVKPFNKLMSKVVFAMSGYQNPERGKVRDLACAMGATYKPDWGKGCTHLLCAFQNTPKYNVVKGKGRIVEANWVKACHRDKRLLPWRKYRVGRARTPPGSSDEECIAEEIAEKNEKRGSEKRDREGKRDVEEKEVGREEKKSPKDEKLWDGVKPSTSNDSSKASTSKKKIVYEDSDDDSVYDHDTDVEEENTDDEIDRIRNADNGENSRKKAMDKLPDYFSGFSFLCYGEMSPVERRLLRRIVVAYGGAVEDYMGDCVTHVVTRAQWDENFDKALGENNKLVFLRPEWVYECDKHQKLVKYDEYCVSSD